MSAERGPGIPLRQTFISLLAAFPLILMFLVSTALAVTLSSTVSQSVRPWLFLGLACGAASVGVWLTYSVRSNWTLYLGGWIFGEELAEQADPDSGPLFIALEDLRAYATEALAKRDGKSRYSILELRIALAETDIWNATALKYFDRAIRVRNELVVTSRPRLTSNDIEVAVGDLRYLKNWIRAKTSDDVPQRNDGTQASG